METSLDYTDTWQSLATIMKADTDIINVPNVVKELTLANRSANEVIFKRTESTSAPSVNEGFRLDAEGSGIWYITLKNVNLSKTWLKTTVSAQTGEVDASVEI
mgnify:CR=1 FL=1